MFTLKKSLSYAFGAGLLVATAVASTSAMADTLNGAGGTAIYPVLSDWAVAYQKISGTSVNYQAIGSGGGIKQIESKTVPFANSDKPLTPDTLAQQGLVQFPGVIIGITPVVNLPHIKAGELVLDGKTLADIYSDALSLGMQARPWLIKPNLGEFHQLLGRQTLDLPDLAQACLALRKETGTQIALSMERQGLLLTASQAQWWLRPPALEMHLPDGPGINVIGCGDALVGALAFEYCRTRDLLAAARLGLAAAHVNPGTYGSPEIDPLHARQLAGQVQALRL